MLFKLILPNGRTSAGPTECSLAYYDLESAAPPTILVSPHFDAIVFELRAVVPSELFDGGFDV
jgi:hypothetical protein